MNEYSFYEGPVPSGYAASYTVTLYHHPFHLSLQAKEGWHSYFIVNEKNRTIEASVHFHVAEGVARSPRKSPFGSVEFSDDLSPVILFEFLEYVELKLQSIQVSCVIITNPPHGYNSRKASLLQIFFFNLGFQIKDAEVGALIPVTPEKFENRIDRWEKRKLRQGKESGLVFRELILDQLDASYLFILNCRQQKAYPLSMTLPEVQETVGAFPDRFLITGVYHEEKMIASSIAIRVSADVLYNFYSAHDGLYDSLSPVVFLIEGLYEYCQRNQIALLDLGTSALEGKPNFGLLDFKLRLGAEPTSKLTFEKILS